MSFERRRGLGWGYILGKNSVYVTFKAQGLDEITKGVGIDRLSPGASKVIRSGRRGIASKGD